MAKSVSLALAYVIMAVCFANTLWSEQTASKPKCLYRRLATAAGAISSSRHAAHAFRLRVHTRNVQQKRAGGENLWDVRGGGVS